MLEDLGRARRSLRRFCFSSLKKCAGPGGYHNAVGAELDTVALERGTDRYWSHPRDPEIDRRDPRWPQVCAGCGYAFEDADEWQIFSEHQWAAPDGRIVYLYSAPPGAMWDAWWMGEWARGPDGRALMVVCPDGRQWLIDGPASNCTMKDDRGPFGQAHRCWTRSGEPPAIIVSKAYYRTCNAGGGSIDTGGYHGFLGTGGAQPGEFT